ncbi:MAG: tRNA (adenosine(37)-N6)-threonylcarbamoyltransferase complex dimerization subunit type 1 TsaB [Rhodoglobus sp.]
MLLSIDTSAGTSVAVVDREAGILAEHSSSDTRRHAEVIGELIRASLDDSGVNVTDLSGIVAGMGPGPFTGLRVGIAAARAFAWGAGIPVVPVISHDAIAFGATVPVLVATDARRHEVYWSTYSGTDAAGLPARTSGPNLAKAAELELAVAEFDALLLLDGGQVSAGALGLVAELLRANGRPFATDAALYLRSPDVTLSAGPKRVTA